MRVGHFAEPFPHWTVEGLFGAPLLAAAAEAVPPADWPHWVRYDNDCERSKRTCREAHRVPAWRALFAALNGLGGWLSELTGVRVAYDPTLHGAGLHVTDPGGWLNPHLDYARHPTFGGLERRVNLVLFLDDGWRAEWGGAFELWDDSASEVVKRIYPSFGRAVAWLPSDTAFHGTQQTAPDAPPRVTAAAYYLAPARPGATRKRALFVPRR